MAVHKSALRQHRHSLRRRAINKRNESALRTAVKKMREILQAKNGEAAREFLPRVFSIIDRTAKKGTIHRARAARLKSRLSRQVSRLRPVPSP